MSYLLISLAALLVGPITYRALSLRPRALALLDGLVYVAVPSLVLLHIAPDVLGEQHLWPLLAMGLGVFAPLWLEGQTHRIGDRADQVALVLGLAGLCLHALLEGAALTGIARNEDVALATAVVLHRIPVGLAVWWLLRPRIGPGWAAAAVGGLMAVTAGGWFAGNGIIEAVDGESFHLFEAFVGGTLVHVIFHGRPAATHLSEDRLARRFEGVGGLMGILLVLYLGFAAEHDHSAPGHSHADHALLDFGERLLGLALESAPALVLAYLAAGLLSAFMPSSSIRWMARGGPLSSAARGVTVGLPLPVCSCGVVPLYEALVRRGAPPAAAIAFLIATPELGLDAIFLSIPLLGGQMTILRVLVAGLGALLVGWIVGRLLAVDERELAADDDTPSEGVGSRLRAGLRVGLKDVVDHTGPWIVLGLLAAAAATPFLEGGWLGDLVTPWDVIVFTLIGLPTYVCASSATPLVAALMAGGLSPGAAIAFLITGPATNVTTFGIVSRLHGRRGALLFAGTLIAFAVSSGIAINVAFDSLSIPPFDKILSDDGSRIQWLALAALVTLFAASLVRRGVRASIGEIRFGMTTGHHHDHHHHSHGHTHDHDHAHDDPADGGSAS